MFFQLPSHLLHIDPGRRQLRERPGTFLRIFREARPHAAMVAKGVHRLRRERIHGVRPDQLFHVEDIAVLRILRARTRPERPLDPRPLGLKRLKTGPRDGLLEHLIRQSRVGDGGLPHQFLVSAFFQ